MRDGRKVNTVTVDPERGPLIAWAFDAYATGDWSLRNLSDELNTRGLTTRPTPAYAAKPIRPPVLHAILRSPYYKGIVTFRDAMHEGKHDPLVDPATWRRVQDVLAAHSLGDRRRDHDHYLKSSLSCGECHSRVIVTNATNRHGVTYPYFVCLGRHQKTTTCTKKAVLICKVEDLVEECYATVAMPAKVREQILAAVTADLDAERAVAGKERRRLIAAKTRLDNERTKLLQAPLRRRDPLDLLKTEQDRITGELDSITERLAATQVEFDTIAANLDRVLALASDWHRIYTQAPPAIRRQLDQAIFTAIYLHDDPDEPLIAQTAEPFTTLLTLTENTPQPDSGAPGQPASPAPTHDSLPVTPRTPTIPVGNGQIRTTYQSCGFE